MSTPEEFIKSLEDEARTYQETHDLPACVAVAQAALETGWGRHLREYNLFGIKAHGNPDAFSSPTHEYVNGQRIEITDAFRAFRSYRDAFNGLALFLKDNPRYRPALEVRHKPEEFAKKLQECGYATDPQYAEKLISIMTSRGLIDKFPPPMLINNTPSPSPGEEIEDAIESFINALKRVIESFINLIKERRD